jgi:hypothetical protein
MRQELSDMASAQRRHWRPHTAASGQSAIDSDDRIANALFASDE